MQHKEIAAVACIGVPNDYWGETVGVFIQRKAQFSGAAKTGSKDIKLWLRGKLAAHKMPEHFFWLGDGGGVPDELPYNHTGKLLKSDLRGIADALSNSRTTLEESEC